MWQKARVQRETNNVYPNTRHIRVSQVPTLSTLRQNGMCTVAQSAVGAMVLLCQNMYLNVFKLSFFVYFIFSVYL